MRRTKAGVLLLVAWAAGLTMPRTATPEAATPVVVAMALDTSGSVGQENLGRATALAVEILESLPPGSEVAVLTFDDRSRVVVPRTSKAKDVSSQLKVLRIAGRYTALHDALYDASRYLGETPADRKAIVLITDGKDENSALNLEDGLKLARDEGIPVFTVGVGQPQARVLRRIAKLTGGEYLALGEARGTRIASRIAGLRSLEAAENAPRPTPDVRPATPRPAGVPEGAPAIPAATPVSSSGRRGLALAGVLLAVMASLAVVLLKKRKATAPCPGCGRELANPASCPDCARHDTGAASFRERPSNGGEDVSPTVLARMNITEEFLEKTITLKERSVLSVTHGPGAGQLYDLRKDTATSIGRAKANDIVVGDVAVSSQHCRIRPEAGRFVIHDLKSTNGTFVNERKIARHVLSEGDVIKVGETSLQFKLDLKRD